MPEVQADETNEKISREEDTQIHLLQNVFPNSASVSKSSTAGHHCQFRRWSRWKPSSDQAQTQQQKCLLHGEWYQRVHVCTHWCGLKLFHLSKFKYWQTQLGTYVSNDRMHLARSSEDQWFTYALTACLQGYCQEGETNNLTHLIFSN